MSLGTNISFLRKQKKLTQEQLAEQLHVTGQTVSRRETDEIVPGLEKLTCLCDLFACSLDMLVRRDLPARESICSPVTVRCLPAFRLARYVMISPEPENDVNAYMDRWAEKSRLLAFCPQAKRIGWDFPFVTQEQQNRFGLRGYAPDCPGAEIVGNRAARYAVITVRDPFAQPFERIPDAYKHILSYMKEKQEENILSCF